MFLSFGHEGKEKHRGRRKDWLYRFSNGSKMISFNGLYFLKIDCELKYRVNMRKNK